MSASDLILFDLDGERSLYVGPPLLEGLPAPLLEGLARRRMVATGEGCPCGARLVVPNRAARRKAARAGRALEVDVRHEDGCPAIAAGLEAYLSLGRTA